MFCTTPVNEVEVVSGVPAAVQDVTGNGRFMVDFSGPACRQANGVSHGDVYLLRVGSLQKFSFALGFQWPRAFDLSAVQCRWNLNANDTAAQRRHHRLDIGRSTDRCA
jgi:hypothetical protein